MPHIKSDDYSQGTGKFIKKFEEIRTDKEIIAENIAVDMPIKC